MSDSDLKRRRAPRKRVSVLVDVAGSGGSTRVTALISDLSIAGARFLTNAPFKVTDAVELSIRLDNVDQDAPTIETSGKVVRVEPLEKNRIGLWSHAVAVEFERKLSDHRNAIEELSRWVKASPSQR